MSQASGQIWRQTSQKVVLVVLMGASLAVPTAPTAAQPTEKAETHDSFAALRHHILNMISGATWRIWIASEYLTDGEIVSALYIANYRKLDVKVLLGRAKARRYLSRLNYLKSQNIPVFLYPRGFNIGAASAVLADNKIAFIDGELNYQEKNRRFQVTYGTPSQMNSFVAKFTKAAGEAIPAVPVPRPKVGRAGSRDSVIRSGSANPRGATVLPSGNIKRYSQDELEGSYRYNSRRDSPEQGVPTKLPDSTLWEQKVVPPPNQQ